jgi:hypothetical protein
MLLKQLIDQAREAADALTARAQRSRSLRDWCAAWEYHGAADGLARRKLIKGELPKTPEELAAYRRGYQLGLDERAVLAVENWLAG